MAMTLKGWPPSDPIANAEQEIANAEYPEIRMFKVANKFSLEKETSVEGNWIVCSPKSAGDFSATAYFYARRLHKELGVPVGIVNSSWGGTPAESWVSKGRLKELKDFKPLLESIENPNREKLAEAWYARWEKTPYPEKTEDWNNVDLKDSRLAQPDFDDSKWKTMTLPGRVDWHNEQDINGAIWFRKIFEIDDPSDSYTFEMGVVDDVDLVYVNGQKICGTAYNVTDGRTYPIESSILKKGKNTIAIRVIDTGGPGSVSGFIGIKNSKNESISLEGDWKFQITAELYNDHVYSYKIEELDGLVRPNVVTANAFTPTSLYNAMIHPLLPYNIKGAIWYQGESNVGRAEQYEQLFPTLIDDWRASWNKNFPFYFVQIAQEESARQNYYYRQY
jgi:sialate O-acetylesterase